MDMKALDLAIEIAQGPAALARALGIKPPSIFGWYARKRIPAERCAAIEAATGVPRHALRPDIFPAPSLRVAGGGASVPVTEALQVRPSDPVTSKTI